MCDDLVAIAAEQPGMAVGALHRERIFGDAFPEQAGDFPPAPCPLADRAEQFRQGLRREGAAQDFDAIARLDRLSLLAVAQHLDRHPGAGLQFQQLEQRARANLAHLIKDQYGVLGSLKLAALDHGEQGGNRVGLRDSGIALGRQPGARPWPLL